MLQPMCAQACAQRGGAGRGGDQLGAGACRHRSHPFDNTAHRYVVHPARRAEATATPKPSDGFTDLTEVRFVALRCANPQCKARLAGIGARRSRTCRRLVWGSFLSRLGSMHLPRSLLQVPLTAVHGLGLQYSLSFRVNNAEGTLQEIRDGTVKI